MSGEHTSAELLAKRSFKQVSDALTETAAERDRRSLESEQRLKRGAELSLMIVDLQAERDRLKEMFEEWTGYTHGAALDQLRHRAEVAEAERDRLRAELSTERDARYQLPGLQELVATLRAEVERLTEELTYEKIGDSHHQEQYAELRAEKAELVAACREYVEHMEEQSERLPCCDAVLNRTRAAIAKATATEGE